MPSSPIVIVDDDADDLELIEEAFISLDSAHPIIVFKDGDSLKEYLSGNGEAPFLIICDLNIPRQDGLQIRKMIAEDPVIRYKSVPFIFWSTSASEKQIQQAYDNHVQGFFFKPDSFTSLQNTLRRIMDYWSECKHPVQKR